MSLVLLSLAALCRTVLPGEPTVQCGSETGPSPEWLVQHPLTPGDLRELRVELVKTRAATEDYSVLMNISWVLRADASIRLLKATKICVTGKSNFQWYSCVRCNYTEAFQWQTRPSGGKWTFSYVGFPVALSTLYFIGAHNIPNANMNEDSPSLSVNFTSPGSLWDPNITACKKNERMVEVNFTTSPLGNRYMVLIQHDIIIGFSKVPENKLTRTSVVILVTGESEGATVQLIPYFHSCGNDCIRRKGTVVLCPQTGVPFPPNTNRSMLGGWLALLSLLVVSWMLAVGIYLIWRRERIKEASFPTTTLLPLIKVLVVYPPEVCFHHTVCYFTEFLQNHCRSEVILEQWQKKKIAEMGPVQWLTTQKKAADKVIFLLSNNVSTVCDGPCGQSGGSPRGNSQDLFPLAFHLFCSDLSSQTHLHKYIVVYFRGAEPKDDYNALHICPKYRLMKEATALCTQLHVRQHMSPGKQSRACHSSCSASQPTQEKREDSEPYNPAIPGEKSW
ncbi:interleukin-17 receptor B isoform X2 [Heterocephalus glaber]|uniref:Interleukin-17 receptor B isoform X2 n=1 Tax=Heterocephalus glaber TaxID=10181 RepID=A0AAX6QHS6_HETGA|nr:interleukin-17 receptor B isoform X2 [Heterocephalus glaber]